MISQLKHWAKEEMENGKRSKASRIMKVADRMAIENKKALS